MIFEGSCDNDDFTITGINLICTVHNNNLKKKHYIIWNTSILLLLYFDQINAALVSISILSKTLLNDKVHNKWRKCKITYDANHESTIKQNQTKQTDKAMDLQAGIMKS